MIDARMIPVTVTDIFRMMSMQLNSYSHIIFITPFFVLFFVKKNNHCMFLKPIAL